MRSVGETAKAKEKERRDRERERERERKRNNRFAIVNGGRYSSALGKAVSLIAVVVSHHSTTLTFDLLPPPASLRVHAHAHTREGYDRASRSYTRCFTSFVGCGATRFTRKADLVRMIFSQLRSRRNENRATSSRRSRTRNVFVESRGFPNRYASGWIFALESPDRDAMECKERARVHDASRGYHGNEQLVQ